MNYEFDPTLTSRVQNSYAEGMAIDGGGSSPEAQGQPISEGGFFNNGQRLTPEQVAQVLEEMGTESNRENVRSTIEPAPANFRDNMKAKAKEAQSQIDKDETTKPKTPREHLESLLKELRESGKSDVQFTNLIEGIIGMGWKAKRALETTPGLKQEMVELKKRLEQITTVAAQDKNAARLMTLELGNTLKKYYGYEKLRDEQMDFYSTPKNLEDLVERISDVVSDEFSVGGKHALITIDSETGEKRVNKDNLLLWVRRRVWFYHDLNATSKINLLQDIQLPTATRAYYLIELYGTDAYWGKRTTEIYQEVKKEDGVWRVDLERYNREGVVLTDENGKVRKDGAGRVLVGLLSENERGELRVVAEVPAPNIQVSEEYDPNDPSKPKDVQVYKVREVSRQDAAYDRLRDDILYEPYLADFIHNSAVDFRAAMGSEDKLSEVLGSIYSKPNALTEGRDRLLKILRYGSTDKQTHNGKGEIDRQVENNDYTSQGTVGKAVQRLLNAYDYMAEVNQGARIKGVDEQGKEKEYENLFRKSLGTEGAKEFYREVIRITLDKKYADQFGMAKKLTEELNKIFIQEKEGENKGAFRERQDWEKVDVLDILLLDKKGLEGDPKQKEPSKFVEWGISQEDYTRVLARIREDLAKDISQSTDSGKKETFQRQLNELNALTLERKSRVNSQDLRREFLYTMVGKGYGMTSELVSNGVFKDFVEGRKSLEDFAISFSKQSWDSNDAIFLNIFGSIKEVGGSRALVRDALRAAMVKQLKLSAFEAKYADMHAYDLAYIFGSTAKNDVIGIGFNAWSKLMNIRRYREGQVEGKNAYGNVFTINGIKKISFTFYEGMRVQKQGESGYGNMGKGTTLREILQGGAGDNMNLDGDIASFDFYENSMSQFYGDHLSNAFAVFKMLNKIEIEFNKIVSPDPRTGLLTVDTSAFWDFIDKFWKPIRYMLDLQAPNFEAQFRTWTYTSQPGYRGKVDRSVKMTTQSLRDLMFGKTVQDMKMYGFEVETDTGSKTQDEAWKKTGMARNLLAYIIAEQIRFHRQWRAKGAIAKYYGANEIEMLQGLFNSMTRSVAFNGEEVEILRDFFTIDEWDRIAKLGLLEDTGKIRRYLLWFNNPWWRLYAGEYGGDTVGFAADITRELFGTFFKMIFSGLKVGG